MDELTSRDLMIQLGQRRAEHRALDEEILALFEAGTHDQVGFARLKKRKLRIRDDIHMLEAQLIPDIIA